MENVKKFCDALANDETNEKLTGDNPDENAAKAKETGAELTREQTDHLFAAYAELDEEDLANVSGGTVGDYDRGKWNKLAHDDGRTNMAANQCPECEQFFSIFSRYILKEPTPDGKAQYTLTDAKCYCCGVQYDTYKFIYP